MSQFVVEDKLVGLRLDKALTEILEGKSRSFTLKCIEEGKVLVSGKMEKPSYSLKKGDVISYELLEEQPLNMDAKNLNLEIVYEDSDVAVVNKPKGMVVHPGAGNQEDTLVHGLLYELDDLATINGVIRPGIVHRIDKDTTGLLMIAKNDMAALGLAEQLKNHSCKRRYQALVYGTFAESKGKINAPIGRDPLDRKKMAVSKTGKQAITHFTVLKRFKDFTLIECELETGRTHQIRVHMNYIGHPIVGDKVYGRRKVIGDQGQFLHAKLIGFFHPRTNQWMEFDSELPKYFLDFLATIK
ncbi:MAG: RluA family pseudouridine synthase [Roseburia sp.]|nr:RluA family pseudouridine synthase [Anaeroplasma bactoclasticum]MCM1196727.1 RluA family pseudouridine synthase [Roseburia sp.]MCM1557011.1 RluA family pseudouridine synthase [Anaeroplasma bactoclasticum]